MKTFYIIKTAFPFMFLPIAPGVVQVELQRQGLISVGASAYTAVLLQIILTAVVVVWFARVFTHRNDTKAFLKMSCVSKKVFHKGRWMPVEEYLADHHNIVVSHGMTPEESTQWLNEARACLQVEDEALEEAIEKLEPALE